MTATIKAILKPAVSTTLSIFPSPNHPSMAHPGLHLNWRLGWIRAQVFRFRTWVANAMLGSRVEMGKRVSIQGRLRIKGPGRVIIGDDVIIGANTDIYTHSPEAVIQIGDGTFLNGTRFGCVKQIQIGRYVILGDARIMDTDFHSVSRDRHNKLAPIASAPVKIQDNVWVAAGAAVLKGVTIGANSVVAFGSVVAKDVAPDKIVGGNPCKEIGDVPA